MIPLRALDTPSLHNPHLFPQTFLSITGHRSLPELGQQVQPRESEQFFKNHPALANFFESLGSNIKNAALNRAVKALHVISSNPGFFTETRINALADYYTDMRSQDVRVEHKAGADVIVFGDQAKLTILKNCQVKEKSGFQNLNREFRAALLGFWQTELVHSPSGERLMSTEVSPVFNRIRPRDTELLLNSKYVFQGVAKPKTSVPLAGTSFETHAIKMVEPIGECEDLPWDIQEARAGFLLSVPGAADLSSATDIHVVHASHLQRGRLCLPPSGKVILAVTRPEYRASYQSLFQLAETNQRIRVFVARSDDPSAASRRLHTAMWAIDMLQHARGEKRLHMLEDNVKRLWGDALDHHAGRNTIQVGARYSALSIAGKSPGDFQCAVWHFPRPEAALAPLQTAVQAFRFLPTDFSGAGAFLHFCLHKMGMGFEPVDALQFAWEEDRSGLPAQGNGTETYEKTYGDSRRLQAIKQDIQGSKDLPDEQKKCVSKLCSDFFALRSEGYEKQMKGTRGLLSKLSDSGANVECIALLEEKLAGSSIRQGLYDAMNRFTASENDRILFVTAPCGVGKTLALSLLSVRREGRAAWFSFPTNQLAKEFQQAAPSRNLSVHCQGDVTASELGKLEQHGTNLETAVFVHPTLLHAVGGTMQPSTIEGLTLFIDEWHNLSDDQLNGVSAFLDKTHVKLVLLSATPREEQVKSLKRSYQDLHQVHEISVDEAIREDLLRPRLVLDGSAAFFSKKREKDVFETRFKRAQATLEAQIQGQALWRHSGVIYVDNTKQADQVCAVLREEGRYPGLTVFNATGMQPESTDFSRTPFALVCCKRYREGANIPALNYVLALGSLTDTAAIQIGGRLSRKFDNGGGLLYGLMFAFGEGSAHRATLRSDRGASAALEFLKGCQTREGKRLIDELPMLPPVRYELFPHGGLTGLKFRLDLNALPSQTGERESFLGRKRALSKSSRTLSSP